jgi:hypothetical protein
MSNAERQKQVRILAKSIYRELASQGFDERQIVALATELISEVTQRMASESSARESSARDAAAAGTTATS